MEKPTSPKGYTLSDELARLSLPAEYKEAYRKLAYANSICFLFLLIGIIGIKSPRLITKPLSELNEPVPVVYTPPEEAPPVQQQKPDEEPTPQETPIDAPQVAPVVAVIDSPAVAFPIPVPGAVAVATEVRHATPPPPVTQAPPRGPVKFDPNSTGDGGVHPKPIYPGFAQRNHYQGTVEVLFTVDETGKIISADVMKSSGYPILDQAAVEVVKNKWKFPPGRAGKYISPFQFKLE